MSIAQKKLSVVALAAMLALALGLGGLAGSLAPEQAFADEPAAQVQAKTYTIKYKGVSGAKNANPTQAEKGKLKLKKPTKAGYTFLGWYQGKKKVTTVNVTKNLTLTAKWKAKTYKITYKNVKGTNKNAKKFTYGKSVKLKSLKKSGYTFMGWYSDKYLTKKVSKVGGKTAKNITVYAKWVKTPKTANEKFAVKEVKKYVKWYNSQAKEVSDEVYAETQYINGVYVGGIWIDPSGKKIGCSKKEVQAAVNKTNWPSSLRKFAMANSGVNWYQQALMTSKYCAGIADEYELDPALVKEFARSVLEDQGFTKSEINYALKNTKF